MNWSDHFRELKRQQTLPTAPRSKPTSVQSLDNIPPEATPADVYRLPVEVVRIDERETKTGDPCYFLHVKDSDGLRFSVVCWEAQWPKVRERVTVGQQATLDVKVPAGDHSSFTLAGA